MRDIIAFLFLILYLLLGLIGLLYVLWGVIVLQKGIVTGIDISFSRYTDEVEIIIKVALTDDSKSIIFKRKTKGLSEDVGSLSTGNKVIIDIEHDKDDVWTVNDIYKIIDFGEEALEWLMVLII